MTLTESIQTLKDLEKLPYWKADREALTMARKALETMKDINEAESVEQVVEILKEYISEVEV